MPSKRKTPLLVRATTGLSNQVVELARHWKRGEYISVKALELAHTLLDEPDFDAAIEDTYLDIIETIGEGYVTSFFAWLRDCASMILREGTDANGQNIVTVNHLFVVPVEGEPTDTERLLEQPEAIDILVQSFKRAYVIAPGENLTISSTPICLADLAISQPGEIRTLNRLSISPSADDRDRAQELLARIRSRSRYSTAFERSEPICLRAFIGVSTLSEPDGPDAAAHVEPNATNRFLTWHDQINRRLGSPNITIQQPMSWNKAIARMTIAHIQKAFETDASHKDRNNPAIEGRVLHVAPDEGGVLMLALERETDVLGPIPVPAILAAKGGETVTNLLQGLALEIREHEYVGHLPVRPNGFH